ncbi:AAA family ATPase [Bradyrhizobium sp.]|uniref:AAA family ATPase n=1 Tax=Bradyrhizobium sp. TaxID=376 RepID=UPI003C4EF243
MDVGDWLRSLGLEKYEQAFVANAIDSDVLPDLTEVDLEKLGIPLGDRKRLVKAIKVMAAHSTSTLPSADIGKDAPDAQPAERRHLTVMICDLVGSTALSARLDPEDMGAVIDAYQATCARITLSYDGFIADFRGDGIFAYFGYPRAHEDDAERTVRAALDIVAAVARLETRAGEPLSVRIGVATGLVVVGDLSGKGGIREHSVVGDAPNIAARLQGLVEPNSVVVAESTRRLVGNLFRLRDLGPHGLRGLGEPVGAWLVEGLSPSGIRFRAVRPAGLADLVGREAEMEVLIERQRLAWKGEGQVMLISGEAGIGKSRLAAAIAEHVASEPHAQFRYQCSLYHANSPLRPVIEQLERAAEFKSDDTSGIRLEKLEALLSKGPSPVETVAPLFAALLSLPFGDRYPPLTFSPAQQRRRTLAALLDQFEGSARRQPVLLLFEDAHWADATSLELLDLVVERARHLPIFALVTSRPEFEPPWVGLGNVGTLTLGRLDRRYIESIATHVSGGRKLPAEVMKQVVDKTDGNPLFVEELTRVILEAGILVEHAEGYRLEGPLPPLAIPATLQDSLMARIDRLVSVKEIAQIGAAIGREFSYSWIRAVVARDDAALQHALAELERAELVYRRGVVPEAVYSFKHALVRDAAYESMLKSRRQQLHGQIARALQNGFPDVAESEPEVLARHFTEAGLVQTAIDYWLKAGHLALGRSANAEAVKHLRRGIEVLGDLEASLQRDRKELDFYLALGPAVAATEGDAAQETSRVFARARQLLGDGGTPTEQMTVLWGNYLAHSMRAEHAEALEVARQCLTLASEHEHFGMSALANRFMGQTLYFMGAFADARIYLERTLAICAANQEIMATYRRFGTDDQVNTLTFLAVTLFLLGYPDQSAITADQAVARMRKIGHAFTTALALSHMAVLGIIGGDPQLALAKAEEAVAISVENELGSAVHRARFFQGALLAQGNDPQLGIELMRNAIAEAEDNSERNRRTVYLCHVAMAHARLDQPDVGLGLLDEALGIAETTNEKFFEAELCRLRGMVLLSLGKKSEAEAELRRALLIAQQQQARWWELRAANSLAEHFRDEGNYAEACSIISSVSHWFVEGFDTPDLKQAKALLDQLSCLASPQTQTVQEQ